MKHIQKQRVRTICALQTGVPFIKP